MKPNRLQARGVTRVPSARCGQPPVKLQVPDLVRPNSECNIHQSTWQYQADKCIDGDIDGDSGGGQPQYSGNMCHTKGERSSWLAIDYGTPVIVQRVEIFNRDDCCGGRTKNVEVWISNHLLKTRNLLGTFVGPAADGQLITISG